MSTSRNRKRLKEARSLNPPRERKKVVTLDSDASALQYAMEHQPGLAELGVQLNSTFLKPTGVTRTQDPEHATHLIRLEFHISDMLLMTEPQIMQFFNNWLRGTEWEGKIR